MCTLEQEVSVPPRERASTLISSNKAWADAAQNCKRQFAFLPSLLPTVTTPITVPARGLMTLENIHSNMELVGRSGLSGRVRPGVRPSPRA